MKTSFFQRNFESSGFSSFFWAWLLSFGWLIPTRFYPWGNFFSDYYIASILIIYAASQIASLRMHLEVTFVSTIVICISIIPVLQYASGLIELKGQLAIGAAYIIGFGLCIAVGEGLASKKGDELFDFLLGAILIASICSVGLQLQQFFQLDINPSINMGSGPLRPHANLGQPNQLGTLLILGLISTAWMHHRNYIGKAILLVLIFFLTFGIVITKSVTAAVGLIVAAAFAAKLSRSSKDTKLLLVFACAIAAYLAIKVLLLIEPTSHMASNNLFEPHKVEFRSGSLTNRFDIWLTLWRAVIERPFFGYGWNETLEAQLNVATHFEGATGLYYYAHNIILDLLVWCGIPIGGLIVIAAALYLFNVILKCDSFRSLIVICSMLVVINHSVVEFPYAYGYILFPVGFLVGVLNNDMKFKSVMPCVAWWQMLLVTFICMFISTLMLVDHARSMEQYHNLVYQELRVEAEQPAEPKPLLLDQWAKYIKYSIKPSDAIVSDGEVNDFFAVTRLIATPSILWKLHLVQLAADRPEEATETFNLLCRVFTKDVCEQATYMKLRINSPMK